MYGNVSGQTSLPHGYQTPPGTLRSCFFCAELTFNSVFGFDNIFSRRPLFFLGATRLLASVARCTDKPKNWSEIEVFHLIRGVFYCVHQLRNTAISAGGIKERAKELQLYPLAKPFQRVRSTFQMPLDFSMPPCAPLVATNATGEVWPVNVSNQLTALYSVNLTQEEHWQLLSGHEYRSRDVFEKENPRDVLSEQSENFEDRRQMKNI